MSGESSYPTDDVLPSFNQDYSCFACGTTTGFQVFNTDPFKEMFKRDFATDNHKCTLHDSAGGFSPDSAGIAIVAMLYRSNMLALVGGGPTPRWPPTQVMLWDDRLGRCIAELTFSSTVRNVKLLNEVVVVALERKVFVYRFRDLQLIEAVDTIQNPRGLMDVASSPSDSRIVLACPGLQRGRVLVVFYSQAFGSEGPAAQGKGKEKESPEMTDRQQHDVTHVRHTNSVAIIAAHETPLACVALNSDATLLATASQKGTIIRLFTPHSGQQLRELRRGADQADIYSIAFHPSAPWLLVASDKGTVHAFALPADAASLPLSPLPRLAPPSGLIGAEDISQTTPASARGPYAHAAGESPSQGSQGSPSNPRSSFRFLSWATPYFASEWSFAQLKVPDGRCVCGFGADRNSVIVLCADGTYLKARFDPVQGGPMKKVQLIRYRQRMPAATGASSYTSFPAAHPALAPPPPSS
ncbi:unnamed protein product [Vitrella brassicaformis CCMP3155]|uniref:Autophagy-related protein 18 n=1 Tax=Vitrella brassicaformis (strain CCMP3155) TaxID=1169540 RepID=A0A0G4GZR8_VITBC|nr:unnamed protein product [Vitrella brassicaformis CCMP3155]|eukprot:CEM36577.1 unnamed protein product [Vitrella brassicaformis CCMP3155]